MDGKMYIVVQDNQHRGELIEIDVPLKNLFNSHGYKMKILKKWERHHLGKRNISKNYPTVYHKHFEKLLVIYK